MNGYEGRTAVVTGSGRGIGQAIAIGLARGGARVVITARTADQLQQTAQRIGTEQVRAVVADLATASGRAALLKELDGIGEIDVLVNNAATVAPLGSFDSLDPSAVRAQFELNVMAPIELSQALLPAMVDRGWGRILNVSSGVVAAPGGMIGGNAYVATKSALEAVTLNLAAEVSGTGVTLNVYRPGVVDTAMQGWIRAQEPERIGPALHERFMSYQASGVLITPEQSAEYVLSRLGGNDTGTIWSFGS